MVRKYGMLFCFILLIKSSNAALPRGSIAQSRRIAVKENKHDPPDTDPPTAHPTVSFTGQPSSEVAIPSGQPTKTPREQTEAPEHLPTSQPNTQNPTVEVDLESPTRSLTPFVLEFRNSPRNGTVVDLLVERYLHVGLKTSIATLVDVQLDTFETKRKLRGLQSTDSRMYHGSVTIGDPSILGSFVRTAQTTVLEDTVTMKQFFANSDLDVTISRVQVGDREPLSIPTENRNEEVASSAPNVALIAPVAIAFFFIVVASILLIRYRRNKTPQSSPYLREEDNHSSLSLDEDVERFGKSRTMQTEIDSPSERVSSRRLSSSQFLIQESFAGGGMEVVQLDLDGEDRIVQLASVPPMSPSRSWTIRSHSPNSLSVFSNSNDSTALRSSAMRCGRSRTADSHTTNYSAQLTLDSTKSVAAFSMLGSSSASYTDDSINEVEDSCLGVMVEPDEDIFVHRNPTHVSHSSSHSEMHHICCTKSEETERRFNPPNKWLAPPKQPPLSPLDDLLRSDSSAVADASSMALESVLNPVRHSEETSDRAIEVFVDSDSASLNSGGEEEDYHGDAEGDSLAKELLKSMGSIQQADSFGSEPSDQKRSLPMLTLNQTLLGRVSKDQEDELETEPRVVSPTTSSHENVSDEENDAPSDEETRFMQIRNSFEYSHADSENSERDILEESTSFPTFNSTMGSISYSSSSVASQDSASQFDPVFMQQLKWEKRRAKAATRKLQCDQKQIAFDMDL